MKLETFFLLPLFIVLGQEVRAQSSHTNLLWEQFLQQWSEDTSGEILDESTLSLLTEWHEHPLNLNTVTRSQLEQIPFLHQENIDAILLYVRWHPLKSLDELMLIKNLSPAQQRWVQLFFYVSADNIPPFKKHLNTEVMTRLDVPLYQSQDYSWARSLGNRVKYVGSYGASWEWALHLDKDAGEPMFTADNPLWDSHGGFLKANTNISATVSASVLVGDYKASFGEGLVLNNAFNFGKSSTGMWKTTNGITGHKGTDEYHFLRGVAATMTISSNWKISAFYSWRQYDATISANNTISSITTNGYHRTENEIAKRHSVNSHLVGAHADWNSGAWHAGTTGYYQYYDHLFQQPNTTYRQIYPQGYQFGAFSLNYGYGTFPFYFRGETARSFDAKGGGWATLNKATWRFNSNTHIAFIQRFYSKAYYSSQASAFGEESTNRNESGAMILFQADRLGNFSLKSYADFFYSPWPRYTMSRSSWGWEGMLQGTWQPSKRWTLLLKYQCKSKESSDLRHYSHRLRASACHHLSAAWTLQLACTYHFYTIPSTTNSHGLLAMPRVDYNSKNQRWRWSLAASFFYTTDYNSRIYQYEPSLFQAYGLQLFYGTGQRLATTLRFKTLNQRWDLQLKAALTHQTTPNQSTEILHPDLQFLARYHF